MGFRNNFYKSRKPLICPLDFLFSTCLSLATALKLLIAEVIYQGEHGYPGIKLYVYVAVKIRCLNFSKDLVTMKNVLQGKFGFKI